MCGSLTGFSGSCGFPWKPLWQVAILPRSKIIRTRYRTWVGLQPLGVHRKPVEPETRGARPTFQGFLTKRERDNPHKVGPLRKHKVALLSGNAPTKCPGNTGDWHEKPANSGFFDFVRPRQQLRSVGRFWGWTEGHAAPDTDRGPADSEQALALSAQGARTDRRLPPKGDSRNSARSQDGFRGDLSPKGPESKAAHGYPRRGVLKADPRQSLPRCNGVRRTVRRNQGNPVWHLPEGWGYGWQPSETAGRTPLAGGRQRRGYRNRQVGPKT